MNLRILIFTTIALFIVAGASAQNTDTVKSNKTVTDSSTTTKINNNTNNDPVLVIVEVMPEFPGGDEALYSWLARSIKYPQVAKETGISGTVIITFIVEKNGTITHEKVLKGIGGGCDEEALRVIRAMPKWKPGKQNGDPVRVQFNLPIRFSLE